MTAHLPQDAVLIPLTQLQQCWKVARDWPQFWFFKFAFKVTTTGLLANCQINKTAKQLCRKPDYSNLLTSRIMQ